MQGNRKKEECNSNVNTFMVEPSCPSELLKQDAKDVWLFDSGTFKHMTHHRNWFSEFYPSKDEKDVTWR